MSNTIEYCILGAGLAGVSLAHELVKVGTSVCLIDPQGIASGASGTPLGLVNPATGRYATLSWDAERCYSSILDNLRMVQEEHPTPFFKRSGILRPALDEKIATKMMANFENTLWPNDWIEWFDEDALKNFHPGITCFGGGVWLPIGLTVDIAQYLNHFVDYLEKLESFRFVNTEYELQKSNDEWLITFSDGTTITAEHLIYTTGATTRFSKYWDWLSMHPVKGQLAVLESRYPLSFDHAVSALGYITSLSDSHFVIGSTYEHRFEHEQIDDQGLDYLLTRFGKVLPELKSESKLISQWTGTRVSTPNRMPILGKHPSEEKLYLFTGLGSKGLLYSAYLAQKLRDYLISTIELPESISINRFQ